MPGAVGSIPKRKREDRRLVPQLRCDVPTGRLDSGKHSAIYRAHYALLTALVDGSTEIADRGGVRILDETLKRILIRAGLDIADLGRVLEAWLDGDGDDAPPLIERVGTDVFKLGPAHELEWAFIAEGGARRVQAKANGKAAAKTRQAR